MLSRNHSNITRDGAALASELANLAARESQRLDNLRRQISNDEFALKHETDTIRIVERDIQNAINYINANCR